jgi:hypothetical protein
MTLKENTNLPNKNYFTFSHLYTQINRNYHHYSFEKIELMMRQRLS